MPRRRPCQWVAFPNTPINIPLNTAKYAEESLSKVFLRVQVVLRLPCPVFPTLNKVPNHAYVEIQLTRSTILHHVHTPDHDVMNRWTPAFKFEDQRIIGPIHGFLKWHFTVTRSMEMPTERYLSQDSHDKHSIHCKQQSDTPKRLTYYIGLVLTNQVSVWCHMVGVSLGDRGYPLLFRPRGKWTPIVGDWDPIYTYV